MAKLSDFGSSLLHLDNTTKDGRLREEFRGTDYFMPPEREYTRSLLAEHAKAADIYCWGLLLWQVLVDGNGLNENGRLIDTASMTALRRSGEIAAVAVSQVEHYFETAYALELHDNPSSSDIRMTILSTLRSVLARYPQERPSASSILSQAFTFDPKGMWTLSEG